MLEHVDPFIGTAATDLPLPHGLAETWWWPKPQVGNTHPGATSPALAWSAPSPTDLPPQRSLCRLVRT